MSIIHRVRPPKIYNLIWGLYTLSGVLDFSGMPSIKCKALRSQTCLTAGLLMFLDVFFKLLETSICKIGPMDPLFAILDCAETNSLEVGNMFFIKWPGPTCI